MAPTDTTSTPRRAVYPGSFNPPTTAHLAIAAAVREQRDVDSVTWSVSRRALAKEDVEHPRFEHRLSVLAEIAADIPWLEISVTEHQLLSAIADSFDVLIMGADKWHQIQDPVWYDDDERKRDEAIASLPRLAIAPRPPLDVPAEHAIEIDADHNDTSSTRARDGDLSVMLPAARAFAIETGAWIEPVRYEKWWASRH